MIEEAGGQYIAPSYLTLLSGISVVNIRVYHSKHPVSGPKANEYDERLDDNGVTRGLFFGDIGDRPVFDWETP